MKISGWGRYPWIEANEEFPRSMGALQDYVMAREHFIPRGLGRSYGDSSLAENAVSMLRLNRMLAFDAEQGILTCEAGVSIGEILEVFVPRGWFLRVVPGTKFVTVGGAIASDIHGKNHHKDGSFADHLLSMEVMLPDGSITTCSKEQDQELFQATCGGMGLSGVILTATFRLMRIESAYISQLTVKAGNLDEIISLFEGYAEYTYSVAWIDCVAGKADMGRSVLMLGEHAGKDDLSLNALSIKPRRSMRLPFEFPGFALNRMSVKAFNALYYRKAPAGARESIVDYDTFFFPLDRLLEWNKIYGKRGFTQYQFVIPRAAGPEGCRKILQEISTQGSASFLAVLKLLGPENQNMLSFPMEGYTLALDFPARPKILGFLDRLDDMVADYGGRLYMTKDVRMSADMFFRTYRSAERFIEFRHRIDPDGKLESLQSQRLGI